MAMLDVGDKAPAFSLEDQSGKTVKLSDFKGRKVVVYFYPKDDTPGCTREACAFRDEHSALQKAGAVVSDPEVKEALDRGDTVALLRSPSVHRLLQDPEALVQLARLRQAVDQVMEGQASKPVAPRPARVK